MFSLHSFITAHQLRSFSLRLGKIQLLSEYIPNNSYKTIGKTPDIYRYIGASTIEQLNYTTVHLTEFCKWFSILTVHTFWLARGLSICRVFVMYSYRLVTAFPPVVLMKLMVMSRLYKTLHRSGSCRMSSHICFFTAADRRTWITVNKVMS